MPRLHKDRSGDPSDALCVLDAYMYNDTRSIFMDVAGLGFDSNNRPTGYVV